MATLDKTGGVIASVPHNGLNKFYTIEREVDLAGVATGDVLEAIKVKAGTLVLNVCTKIVTPSDKVTTANVGDGAAAAGFDAAINLAAAADTRTKGTAAVDAYVTDDGKLYSAADTIDLTVTVTAGPIGSGKVLVQALCVDL